MKTSHYDKKISPQNKREIMPKPITPLTDKQIKNIKPKEKDFKLSDGGGLYLLVTLSGGKHWKLKYYFDGKEKKLSLGTYPNITLLQARKLRDTYKSEIANGINPQAQKQIKKELQKIESDINLNTFEKLSREYLTKVKQDISEHHYIRTLKAFERDCFKLIGSKPINDITSKDILEILQRMAKREAKESGRKLFYSISKVFKWSIANNKADKNPTTDILLEEILGKKSKVNYPTITDNKGIRGLLLAIDSYQGEHTTKQALKLQAYTALRPFNIRNAEWVEIDIEAKQWSIPASKMKTKEDLIIPLTDSVIKILEDMKQYTFNDKYIFHNPKTKSPISDNTLLGAIRRLGYTKEEFVPHGFRAMFSTITHEKSDFKHEVIELQLAHSVGNSVSKAYNRAKYLNERVQLMQWWSDYLDEIMK